MKNAFPRLLTTGLLLACVSLVHAQVTTVAFTSPAFEIGNDSSGTALTTGYTFSVGSFESFTPTTLNTADWLGNFTSLGSINWDTTFTQYSGTANLTNNATPFTSGSQAYVWGYNTQTIASGTEWILLTNSSWTYPTAGNVPTVNWDASDVGTVAVVGFISSATVGTGADPYLQTAAISAVPEPSTYALLAGVAMLGFVWLRRRTVQV